MNVLFVQWKEYFHSVKDENVLFITIHYLYNIHLYHITYFRIVSSRDDHDFLAQLKIPAPWATGKTVETIHPVRDNYKFRETVHIPGARCLFLRFDQRSASQYDYDKVSFILYFVSSRERP